MFSKFKSFFNSNVQHIETHRITQTTHTTYLSVDNQSLTGQPPPSRPRVIVYTKENPAPLPTEDQLIPDNDPRLNVESPHSSARTIEQMDIDETHSIASSIPSRHTKSTLFSVKPDNLPFHKQVIGFFISGIIGYVMTRAFHEEIKKNYLLANFSLTAFPYLNGRIIKYVSDVWLSQTQTSLEDYNLLSRGSGGLTAVALGLMMGALNLFNEFTDKEAIFLALIGMFGGKAMETFVEKVWVQHCSPCLSA